MRTPIIISGLGHHSALGRGIASLESGVLGETKPNIVQKTVLTRHGEREVSLYQAPEVVLPPDIPESIKRRMGRLAKMSFASAIEATENAFGPERAEINRDPTRTGVVVGTAFGAIDLANSYQKRVILEGPAGASPSLFSGSVQNAVASQLSISLGIQGPTSTVTSMDQTAIGSFRIAFDWLRQNVCDHVIVAIGDELSEFHRYAAGDLKLPHARDFDPKSDECTAVAGEGFMSFVLSRADAGGTQTRVCEITDVQIYADRKPETERFYVGCYGAKGQWSRHEVFTQSANLCNATLYGSIVTGIAFEIAIAALATSRDNIPTSCVQITDRGEAQFLSLR